MDYEKEYKETLERAKKLYENANGMILKKWVEEIFPELKEYEDERIKKELIKETKGSEVRLFETVTNDEFVAWLEKQDKKILANSCETCKDEQKPATIDINKMVDDYANNKERGNEGFGKPVNCMVRAYRQGLNDAIGKVMLKPAWSEEDEVKINRIMACLKNLNIADNDILLKDVDWLKSLKQRINV